MNWFFYKDWFDINCRFPSFSIIKISLFTKAIPVGFSNPSTITSNLILRSVKTGSADIFLAINEILKKKNI